MTHNYSTEEDNFLISNVKDTTLKQLTKMFNERFNLNISENAIKCRKHKLGIKSGMNNKGKSWSDYIPVETQKKIRKNLFKQGNVLMKKKCIGSERINSCGYIEIKVAEPNIWKLKHRVLYEKKYGEIPDGYNVIFLDGNKRNLKLSNLKLVSQSEVLIMNKEDLFSHHKELTNTGTLLAKVIDKTRKVKNER